MQKTFKNQQGREFQLIQVKEDYFPRIINDQNVVVGTFRDNDGAIKKWYYQLPTGNYQILCLAKDATEELASEIVHYTLKDGYLKCYYNYVVKHYTHSLFDAKESLTSLLTSLGFKQDDNVLILEKI